MTARRALDLHELNLVTGHARGLGVTTAELDRDGFVIDPVHDQGGYPERQQAHRIAGHVALGNLLWRAAHQIAHDPAMPAAVGAREIGDPGQ